MSERRDTAARRLSLCKVGFALLLALTAAGCDRCGGILPPTRWFHFDPQIEACREQPPRPQ